MTGLTDAERFEVVHLTDFPEILDVVERIVAAREDTAEERGRAEVRAAVEALRSDADWLADWSHSPPAGVLFGDLAQMQRLAYGVRAALGGDPAAAVAEPEAEGYQAGYDAGLEDGYAEARANTPVWVQGHSHAEPICAWPDCTTYLTPDQMDEARAAALRGEAGA